MSNKFSNIKERILYILEIKGITKSKFFEKIGMTYGNFTGKSKETPLNSDAIGNILLEFPDLNPLWLIIGEGEVLKEEGEVISLSKPQENDNNEVVSLLKDKVSLLEKNIALLEKENAYQAKEILLLEKEVSNLKKQTKSPTPTKVLEI